MTTNSYLRNSTAQLAHAAAAGDAGAQAELTRRAEKRAADPTKQGSVLGAKILARTQAAAANPAAFARTVDLVAPAKPKAKKSKAKQASFKRLGASKADIASMIAQLLAK